MASTSRASDPPNASVDQVMAVTGVSKEQAEMLLAMCQDDVQLAINLHLEDNDGASTSSGQVRNPIPPQQLVLVQEPGHGRRSKRNVPLVLDSFRDFHAETRRQEGMMSGESSMGQNGKSTDDALPHGLLFGGSFQQARDHGQKNKKWLLVNIYNPREFSSPILNREVWNNEAIRTIVKEAFVFWQVYNDSEEGSKYCTFYNVATWPYVAIIDPRTGECLKVWNRIDSSTLCDHLLDFLCQNQFEEEPQPAPKRLRTEDGSEMDQYRRAGPSSEDLASVLDAAEGSFSDLDKISMSDSPGESEEDVKKSILDANEDEQLAVAIRNSLAETMSSTKMTEVETTRMNWRASGGDECSFMLRYPDGSKEIIVMPSTEPLKTLTLHVATKGYREDNYMLVVNFPRRVLSDMEQTVTLAEINLHRQETVFVELR